MQNVSSIFSFARSGENLPADRMLCPAERKTSSGSSALPGSSRTYQLRINPGLTSSVFLFIVWSDHFFNRRFSGAILIHC
jgi:hypothetical protein